MLLGGGEKDSLWWSLQAWIFLLCWYCIFWSSLALIDYTVFPIFAVAALNEILNEILLKWEFIFP